MIGPYAFVVLPRIVWHPPTMSVEGPLHRGVVRSGAFRCEVVETAALGFRWRLWSAAGMHCENTEGSLPEAQSAVAKEALRLFGEDFEVFVRGQSTLA